MSQNSVPSKSRPLGGHPKGGNVLNVPIPHEHTCATAIETFEGAVAKNRKKKVPEPEANRMATNWVRNVVMKQIPDANELASFERFIAEKEKQFPLRQPQPKPQQKQGQTVYTIADATRLLSGKVSVSAMVEHLLRNTLRWNPSDRAAIDLEMRTALASANRKRYAAEGPLDANALVRAEEDATNYLDAARRRVLGTRSQVRHGSNGRRDNRPRPDMRAFASADPRPQGPKVCTKPASNDETVAEGLRNDIAVIEADLADDKRKLEEHRWSVDIRAQKIADVKQLKDELTKAKARISAAQQAHADAKKKERIARKQVSDHANRDIPTYKATVKVSKADTNKAQKGGKKGKR